MRSGKSRSKCTPRTGSMSRAASPRPRPGCSNPSWCAIPRPPGNSGRSRRDRHPLVERSTRDDRADGDLLLYRLDTDLALLGECDVERLARRWVAQDLGGSHLEDLADGDPPAGPAVDGDMGAVHEDDVPAPVEGRDLCYDERDRVIDRLLHRRADICLLEVAHVAAPVAPRETHRQGAALCGPDHLLGSDDLARRGVHDIDDRVD